MVAEYEVNLTGREEQKILSHNRELIAMALNFYEMMKKSNGNENHENYHLKVEASLKCIFMTPEGASPIQYKYLDPTGQKTNDEMECEFEKVRETYLAGKDPQDPEKQAACAVKAPVPPRPRSVAPAQCATMRRRL